jgi:hypothetical protein
MPAMDATVLPGGDVHSRLWALKGYIDQNGIGMRPSHRVGLFASGFDEDRHHILPVTRIVSLRNPEESYRPESTFRSPCFRLFSSAFSGVAFSP